MYGLCGEKRIFKPLELNDYLVTVQEHQTFLSRKEALEKQINELDARHKELTSLQSDLYLHYSEGLLMKAFPVCILPFAQDIFRG